MTWKKIIQKCVNIDNAFNVCYVLCICLRGIEKGFGLGVMSFCCSQYL